MKKLLILLLVLCLAVPVIALTACGDDEEPTPAPAPAPGPACTHVDANDDSKCDLCGAEFSDKCDIHVDKNDDGKCDNEGCDADFTDGCDVHVDKNDDGKCDNEGCGESFEDGCDNHVDEDYDDYCDICDEEMDPHEPVYADTYTKTATGHYKAATCCNMHKASANVEPHVDGNTDYICDVCGYAIPEEVIEYNTITIMAKYNGSFTRASTIEVVKDTAMTLEQANALRDFTYLGRGFAEFYTDEEYTEIFDPTAVISSDITIYGDYGNLAGKEITWSHEGTTLTLSGKGDMFDFTNINAVPWYGLTVNNVVISPEITSIGGYSFYVAKVTAGSGMNLTTINLHEGITKIGNYAFYGEALMTSIDFPESLTYIGEHAFRACEGLTYIDIGGKNLEKVDKSAFAQCTGAEYLIFTSAIEDSANLFESCEFKRVFFVGHRGLYDSLVIGYGNSRLDVAYRFYLTENEPQQPGPYWHRNEDGTPAQWCYAIYYLPSGSNVLESIEQDYVFATAPKNVISAENVEFRNNIWHEGYQFSSWSGDKFEEGLAVTKNLTYKGVRGSAVGDGVDYNISGTTLTISGSGKIWDFEVVDAAPWFEGSNYDTTTISEVVIGSNVTYIGSYTFAGLPALESVEIKSNIVEMSTKAFYGCANLKYVYYYGNELEAMNCKGLQNQENVNNLIVYCKEMAKDNVCDSCGYCMDADDEDTVADHEDKLCDVCNLCFEHVNENGDSRCDVCEVCVVPHVDEISLSGKCYVCNVCLVHKDSEEDTDTLCDVCGECVVDHVDGDDEDTKCDACGICMTHTDAESDGVCDVCNKCTGEHVNKDGKCDVCISCIEHVDTDENGECDSCKRCYAEHVHGKCDICGGCISHVDEKCDVCKICLEHKYNEDGVCSVCGLCNAHVDQEEVDGKCDKCGACITCIDEIAMNGKCFVCSDCIVHKDANKDGKCDICAGCIECEDADGDGKCDTCKGCMTCSDGDDEDKKCDTCGECTEHVDGDSDGRCDVCETCTGEHVNKDNKCDVCKKCLEHSSGKCDICARCVGENDPSFQHPDENGDDKCDVCKACLNHIDADVSYLTGKEIIPTICYWRDIEITSGIFARITWEFDKETGVLTIGGEGAIKNYAALADTPWYATFGYICAEPKLNFASIEESVTKIVIREGITEIGANAFAGLANVEAIELPAGVKRIASTAFGGTKFVTTAENFTDDGLLISGNYLLKVDPAKAGTRVLVPTNIATIADGAFDGCSAVTAIRLPNGISGATVESYAGLTALETVFLHTDAVAWGNNPTKDTLPASAQLYYFSASKPSGEGYYWSGLNDPQIWEENLPA